MSSSINLQSETGVVDPNVVTMLDVLQDEQDYEEDCHAVLGGSDEKNCSYQDGYVKRQALYSCATCTTSENPAALCLACSIACHKNHDLVELYTKRNFKCDCGNSKFPTTPCLLTLLKDPLNEKNAYNHNFNGKYCTCERPYPDPDDEEPDDIMLQCIVCEDWFHGRHLEGKLPAAEFDELICKSCMDKHSFLWYYVAPSSDASLTEKIDVLNESAEEETDSVPCGLEKRKKDKEISSGPTFWDGNWRKTLCQCEGCLKLYKDQGCEYLVSQDDTVKAYEEIGLLKQPASQYDQGMSALQNLNRVEQIEAIHGYNELASEFKDYFKRFAENNSVVKEEDIREFFSHMQARKRPRLDLPQFCS